MRGLRSVGIIHRREEVYYATYMKNFFKWMGFSYFDYSLDEENCGNIKVIREQVKDCGVDLLLCLEERQIWQEVVQERDAKRIYTIETGKFDSALKVLKDILRRIVEDVCGDESQKDKKIQFFNKMIDIYDSNQFFRVVNKYTRLIWKSTENGEEDILKCCRQVLKEVEDLIQSSQEECDSSMEYYIYVCEYCKTLINAALLEKSENLEYDVGSELEKINQIYQYDSEFFRAEYLKARMALRDPMYYSFVETYIKSYIKKCPVSSCNSYSYYGLGRYLEKKQNYIRAEEKYELSYQSGKWNIRAIFKVAVLQLNRGVGENAEQLLEQILKIVNFKENKRYLSPMELEYAFKSNMILANISSGSVRDQYYEQAQEIFSFINGIEEASERNEFMEKIFQMGEERSKICKGIEERWERKRLKLHFSFGK